MGSVKYWRWLGGLLRRIFARPAHIIKACEVADLPEKMSVGRVYVVGENGYQWFAALVCPCGCGETLHLNLLPEQRPCWKLELQADRAITITPSIWRTKGCRSHFIIRDGKIIWC